jgi:hypothetical protein
MRVLSLLLLAVAVASACGDSGPARFRSDEPFDAARAMQDVRELATTIGERPAGSASSQKAAEYIADQLGQAHYGVFQSTFSFEVDPQREATLTVGGTKISASTARGSAAGTASGPAAGVGTASVALQAGSLAGKVAIATRGGPSFAEKYEAVRAAGAVALVILNSGPGTLPADLGAIASFPVVTVSGDDAPAVLAAAASGAAVAITVDPPQTANGATITARPSNAHACIYVLAANYDSLAGSPGADENAGGVAVLLEIARQFSVRKPVPEVCFVFFDARFSGGQGSAAYAAGLTNATKPAYLIDVHRIGSKAKLTVAGSPDLANRIATIAQQGKLSITTSSKPAGQSDIDPFAALGVSAVDVSRSSSFRAADDRPDAISDTSLREAGQLLSELMRSLSATATPSARP